MVFLFIFIAKILLISLACPYNGGTVGGYPGCLNDWKLIDAKICSDTCPSMFIDNMQYGVVPSCSLNSVEAGVLFEMYFANVNDLTATYIASSLDSSTQFQNPNSVAYNSQTQTSPLPTIDRGFYFAITSSITCNKSFIPGDYFMLNMWIKPLANGEILNVISSSTSYMKLWADISGRYKFSLKIYDTNNNVKAEQIMTFTAIYSTLWNRASIVISQLDCSNANVNLLINGSNVGSIALSNSEFRFPTLSYTWTIGNIGSSNSFRGFIYWLKVRANGGLNTAPSTVTINCIENQYWDTSISTCQNCDPSCSTWPWCVKPSDCLPCDIVDCTTCQGYPPLACISCTTGVPPNCCDYLATACSQTWINTACSTGYFLIGGICLYACPYGFGNCVAVSTAVLTADFTGAFAGSYGTDLITGSSSSSYNYWNSPEISDPFPAKSRGLYFNSNQFLSGDIDLSNTWSIALWIYPISGTIISHSTGKLTVDSSGTITFYLEKWDGSVSPTSYSASNTISTSTWTYLSYSAAFDNKATTMTSYINNIDGAAITIPDYVFRLPAGGTLYIGKGSPNFNGLIAYFILWQISITDFSAYYSIGTLTGGLVSFLWSCDYSNYYDGSTYKPCLTSCTNGCTRDTSCYICDDFLCSQCSSFASGTCILCISNASGSPCSCNPGFYQPTNQALCSTCYNGCSHCTGTSYHLCTSCNSSYYFYNDMMCLSECPTGYTANTTTSNCDLSETAPLSLPEINQILLGRINGTQVGSSFTNNYPTFDSNDPIPAYLRGYYFNSNSYITTPFMLAPSFSSALWIKATSSGMVLTKYSSSTTKWFLEILSSGYLKFALSLIDTSTITITGSSSVFNSWYFVWFDCKINSDGTTTISSYIDLASQGTSTSLSALFLLDSSTGNFNIGLNSGGFSGFLWKFKVFSQNDNVLIYYRTVGCLGGCTKCPGDSTCPDDCPITQWYDGASCSNCISSCTKGCRSSDTCKLCLTKECATCRAFTGANSCLSCINNAISDGNGGCTCAANAFWVSSTETCEICDNACSICEKTTYFECSTCLGGYQKTGNVCLNECPYGTSCSTVITTVIDQSFDADFQGSYGIFTTGTSASTFQFSRSPEIVDPIPAYKRGLYFDGTMYLLSSTTVYLSHSFSIGVWLYVITNGDLLEKQTFLTMASTGTITATMVDALLATSSQTLLPSSSFTGWSYLSITFEYSLGSTTLTIYINGISSSTATATNKIYRDQASTNLILGKSNNNGFKGFLYYFQLWNTPISEFSTIISSFAFCSLGNGASCLWTCGISSYIDGASTSSCSSCSYGCRRVGSCNICDDTLCIACNGFDSGKCTQCHSTATFSSGLCSCNPGLWKSSDGLSCISCYSLCLTCSTPKYNGCLTCISNYYLIQSSFCMPFCPTGYIINGGNCDRNSNYTNYFVFNLMPHQIKDVVTDLKSNIPVITGNGNQFYPDYDSADPIAAIHRGYYFTGSSYMQLPPYTGESTPLLTFSPKFTISAWIKPISSSGVIFSKQENNGSFKKYISLELINKFPSLILNLLDSTTTTTFTSSNPLLKTTLSQWNFISAISDISSTPQQIITLSINEISDISIDLGESWLSDLENSFFITIGSFHIDTTTLSSLFNGFLWDLKIYNTILAVNYLVSTTCSGCSICPIDNSNSCLDNCDIDKYWDGNSCISCSSGCLNKGCVRSDKNCNLCKDIICEICDDYASTCITCKTHASLVSSYCQCNSGYSWNTDSESCEICDNSCKTCKSSNWFDCLTCYDGLYEILGICSASCPSGYVQSGGACLLVKEKIFDLDLNTLNGVIFDSASSIPVITGSTKKFYPDYEADDPIPAYLRGFYFNGQTSVLRMPLYSNYTSPILLISPIFTVSTWINTEISYGALLSKHNISDDYSILFSILLINSKPSISFALSSSPVFYNCEGTLNNYMWSHVIFTLEMIENGYSKLSCYLNGLLDSPGITIYGAFQDKAQHTTMSIGAQLSPSSIYNYYQGFIYQIQIFNVVKPISSLSTTYCTESCSVCPTNKICIPNCKIKEYWIGPSYNSCYNCNIKCKNSCRDSQSTCSLCSDLLCDVCNDYSLTGCLLCKENAINPDSCICDINHVLDSSNNSTCISIEDGGYRGSDGKFYLCPNLCTTCDSSTNCSSCAENASVNNGLCYCNLGYKGTKNCTISLFSADLIVFSDNSLYLTFSESLANSLTTYDFTITIENQGKISCKMEELNSTCYYISLNIAKAISKGTLATLEFLKIAEIRSVSNSILNSSVISVSLNSYDPEPTSADIEATSSQMTAGVQAAVSGVLAVSIINPNPSSFWSMMNTLQILSYLTLSGIPFSSKMRTFLSNLNSFDFIPNVFGYIIDKNEGNAPYSQAKDFGYDTDLILINTGNDFALILASLSALPIILFFSRCSYRWLGKKFFKALKAYQFAFYLRFWIQCYLELGSAASIGLIALGYKNMTQIANFIICAAVHVLLVVTPPLFFWFSYKNRNRIQSREKKFTALFSSFFYEFRINRGFLATQYYFVFFIRRLVYIINLVYLRDYPQTEVTINIVLSLMTIMHLFFCWPFKDSILQISNLLTEIMICLVMISTSVYLFNLEQKIVSTIENAIVGIVIGAIVIQAFSSIAIFGRTLYGIIYYKLSKAGIVKSSVKPLNKHIKKSKKINL